MMIALYEHINITWGELKKDKVLIINEVEVKI
jgi:hypothetical protein